MIDRLNAAVVDALADAKVRQRLIDMGQDITAREERTPQALGALQRADMKRWSPIIKMAVVNPE